MLSLPCLRLHMCKIRGLDNEHKRGEGGKQMALQVKEPATKPDDLGQISRIHTVKEEN